MHRKNAYGVIAYFCIFVHIFCIYIYIYNLHIMAYLPVCIFKLISAYLQSVHVSYSLVALPAP